MDGRTAPAHPVVILIDAFHPAYPLYAPSHYPVLSYHVGRSGWCSARLFAGPVEKSAVRMKEISVGWRISSKRQRKGQMPLQELIGGATMFSLIGRFLGWISFRVYLFVADMRYDAAIHDKKRLIRQLTGACAERFKSLYALDNQILQTDIRIQEHIKIANGAATAYLDDSERASFHRVVGEQSLGKIHEWEGKIREWELAKEDNRKALAELKKTSLQAEEDLDFLVHDKPRALADLRAARQELEIGQRNVHWPEVIDRRNREQISLLNQYKAQAKAQREAREFMRADPYQFYKERSHENRSTAEEFDDLVDRRRKAGKASGAFSLVQS